jgi:hypothetical protein
MAEYVGASRPRRVLFEEKVKHIATELTAHQNDDREEESAGEDEVDMHQMIEQCQRSYEMMLEATKDVQSSGHIGPIFYGGSSHQQLQVSSFIEFLRVFLFVQLQFMECCVGCFGGALSKKDKLGHVGNRLGLLSHQYLSLSGRVQQGVEGSAWKECSGLVREVASAFRGVVGALEFLGTQVVSQQPSWNVKQFIWTMHGVLAQWKTAWAAARLYIEPQEPTERLRNQSLAPTPTTTFITTSPDSIPTPPSESPPAAVTRGMLDSAAEYHQAVVYVTKHMNNIPRQLVQDTHQAARALHALTEELSLNSAHKLHTEFRNAAWTLIKVRTHSL